MTSALLRALLIFLIPFYQSTQPFNNYYIYMLIIINGDNPNKRFELCSQNRVLFEVQSWTRPAEPTSRLLVPQWPSTHPDQSGEKNDPVRLQSLFFWGGGVFVIIIASALKGFILKLDMATSIFGSIVIQDCSWILRKHFPLYLFTIPCSSINYSILYVNFV